MLTIRMGQRTRVATIIHATALSLMGILAMPTVAEAHFVLSTPTNWVTTNTANGSPQKTAPCGNEAATVAGGAASAPSRVVNQLRANADGSTTVTITINEVVSHAGWYRVSLVPGLSSTQTMSTLPNPPTPPTTCAATIMAPPVLPVIADGIFRHQQAFAGPQTAQVTIPASVTCTDAMPCTLQVVEVMNDGHTPPSCFYHHCADVAIGSGTGAGGAGVGGNGGARGTGGRAGGTGGAAVTGGASGTGGVIASGGSSAGTGGDSGTGGVSSTGGTTGSTGGAIASTGGNAPSATGGVSVATGGASASTGGRSGADAATDAATSDPGSTGCGCGVAASGSGGSALWALALLGLATTLRSRRRR